MERLSKRIRSKPSRPERILQIGEGNFMRGFIDWQIHRLNEETDFNGSAVVVPPRRGSVTAFQEQDGLYTLYLEGFREGREVRDSAVITSISRVVSSYEHYDEFMEPGRSAGFAVCIFKYDRGRHHLYRGRPSVRPSAEKLSREADCTFIQTIHDFSRKQGKRSGDPPV